MPASPARPAQSLASLSADLQSGRVTSEALTRQALQRIEEREAILEAFTCVQGERALEQARALDQLRRSGKNLGPLMGIPIAVKDLYTVDGMPTTAGSQVDIQDLVPPQGPFVQSLIDAGCVILGKTRTTEFALGGFNLNRPPPWNPCDDTQRRMTGGSSHGSAVAMAAGLAGFTVGSDTGGSVRWPAALCGVVGYKASTTHWPTQGAIPLSPCMDSVGIFTASAADAAIVEAALARRKPLPAPPATELTLALPFEHFLKRLDPAVERCFQSAVQRLRDSGANVVDMPVPEASWIDAVFSKLVPADLAAFLGRERIERAWHLLDAVAAARLQGGLDVTPGEYADMQDMRKMAEGSLAMRSHGIDAWLSPTVPILPEPIAHYRTVEEVAAWNGLCTRNTRPGNLFGQCGISLPIQHLGAALPVGLQLCAARGQDTRLLAVATTIERLLAG